MLDAFHPDDDDRIAGLDVVYLSGRPPAWVRRVWQLDAEYYPLPPGALLIWPLGNDQAGGILVAWMDTCDGTSDASARAAKALIAAGLPHGR